MVSGAKIQFLIRRTRRNNKMWYGSQRVKFRTIFNIKPGMISLILHIIYFIFNH